MHVSLKKNAYDIFTKSIQYSRLTFKIPEITTEVQIKVILNWRLWLLNLRQFSTLKI